MAKTRQEAPPAKGQYRAPPMAPSKRRYDPTEDEAHTDHDNAPIPTGEDEEAPPPRTKAAPAKAAPAKETKAVATRPAARQEVMEAPSVDASMFLSDQRAGMDEVQSADRVVPFLRIAQPMSPELDKQSGSFIPDLEVGDIFNTATKEPWGGEQGILVVPCYYKRQVTEWRPRPAGGGLVRDHGSDQTVVSQAKQNEKGKLVLPNGNEVVVSGTFFCLLINEDDGSFSEVVIPMTSTQMRKARQWNTLMAQVRLPHPIQKGSVFTPAMFYLSYRLTTNQERNDQGTWYGWKIDPDVPTVELENGEATYLAARQFCQLVTEGSVKSADPMTEAASTPGASKPDLDDDIPF